jgi:hypothetical protein
MSFVQVPTRTIADGNAPADINQLELNLEAIKGGSPSVAPTISLEALAALRASANGIATLDASSKVPVSQIPAVALTDTFVVASQAAMLALTAEHGDVAIRTDVSKTFILATDSPSTLADWKELLSAGGGGVSSVNGYTGTVVLAKSDIGLSNVDNTSDATKNAASATLTNKTLTSPVINTPTGIVKGDVGLGNVDNTSDVNKPVSTAQLTAMKLEARKASLRFS